MKVLFTILVVVTNFMTIITDIYDCYFYNDQYNCGSSVTEDTWDERCFQTPTKGGTVDPIYRDSYQGMHYIVGYARQTYNPDKTECTVTIITRVNNNAVNDQDYEYIYTIHGYNYYYGSHQSNGVSRIFKKSESLYTEGVQTSVSILKKHDKSEVAKVEFEKLYFIWNVPEMKYDKEFNEKGQVGVIVELFGWPYEDIIEESDFIKLAGYLGVKITPPNEHVMTENWIESNGFNPWEYFVQPVSYKIVSRFGNKDDLKNLIFTCRGKGIRIYSQVVINHMTHQGNDIYQNHYNKKDENSGNPTTCNKNDNWPGKSSTAGSPYFTVLGRQDKDKNSYNNYKDPIFEYPAVPYCGTDFHCRNDDSGVSNLGRTWIKKSLQDLNTGSEYVNMLDKE